MTRPSSLAALQALRTPILAMAAVIVLSQHDRARDDLPRADPAHGLARGENRLGHFRFASCRLRAVACGADGAGAAARMPSRKIAV